jgi:hypothetical protein
MPTKEVMGSQGSDQLSLIAVTKEDGRGGDPSAGGTYVLPKEKRGQTCTGLADLSNW